ncbi:MAG: ABC transporter ATP-binding protein [Chloroflexi bacterium]|nr:ABC transporter ATP-binding protein [Chloroflexota bacterium]
MSVLIRLFGFTAKYWKAVVLAYVCLLGATAFASIAPWLIKEAIDRGIAIDLQTGIARGNMSLLIQVGALVLVAAAARGAFSYGQSYLAELISQRVAYDIRNALYDRLQRLSFAFHDRSQTGQLMSRATADVEAVRTFISMGSMRSIYGIVLILVNSGILFSLHWRLAMAVLLSLPLLGGLAVVMNIQLRPMWLGIQEGIAQLGVLLQENISGVRVVKAFHREGYESTRWSQKAKEQYDRNFATSRLQAFNTPLMSLILLAAMAFILWYGGNEVIEGRFTLGGLVAFNSYLMMLIWPVRTLGMMANLIPRSISAGQRIFEILDAQSAVKEELHPRELSEVEGQVRFESVSFSYDSVSPVLYNVSFEAAPGTVVALLGPTGCGKTTVVNLIPRFYDVTSGIITIDGTDIRKISFASLRRNVGIVQQDVFLFTASIKDNIAYGAVNASLSEIVTAAKAARIHDFIMSLPQGYDTWVGERGVTLSGGQKQRVAIARTLLTNPRILILDDSTSSVDLETEYLIRQSLEELMQGRTTFIVAQRLSSIRNADLILVFKDGQVVERGTHQELLERGQLYRRIYDLQFREQEETPFPSEDEESWPIAEIKR